MDVRRTEHLRCGLYDEVRRAWILFEFCASAMLAALSCRDENRVHTSLEG